jgi:uncharacterized protein YqfA (UPF0365 family)
VHVSRVQPAHVADSLINAARVGDDAKVNEVLSHYIDGADGTGWTALHHAVAGGHDAVVACLISVKADVRLHLSASSCLPLPLQLTATVSHTGEPIWSVRRKDAAHGGGGGGEQ